MLRFIGTGDMFGTAALFTDHRYPADAISAESSTVLSWQESDLFELIDRYPRIARNVIGILGRRIAELQERVRNNANQRVEQRLAGALLQLGEQFGRATRAGVTIKLPLRRQDLAEYTGTTLHSVSRQLAAWSSAGFIRTSARRVSLCDEAALRRIAKDD